MATESKTISELCFEEFCLANHLNFQRIPEGPDPTCDYTLELQGQIVYVEIKQIDEDAEFTEARGSRSPGSHVRAKINQARDQVRSAANKGFSTILLVYNNLDPWQMFGTEPHDFLAGMYGDLTTMVSLETGKSSGIFHGRNKAFREGKNDTFSAVGFLSRSRSGASVHLYENMYSRNQLLFGSLPACISFNRIDQS
jgi:hypothetical protein